MGRRLGAGGGVDVPPYNTAADPGRGRRAKGTKIKSDPDRSADIGHDHDQVAPPVGAAGPLFAMVAPAPDVRTDVRTTERAAHLEATGAQVRPRGRRSLARILARLRAGTLTSLDALREGLGQRLGARVLELRQLGHDVRTERVTVTNADGSTSVVARYRLVG